MPVEFGPNIDWRGPAIAAPELQGFFQPALDFLDVGFLQRALEQTSSVCRVEIPEGTKVGSGVLIAPSLVLTNYHVLAQDGGAGPVYDPRQVVLRFGCFSQKDGDETTGHPFRLASASPILKQSLPDQLDYVLLQVDKAILGKSDVIKPARFALELPALRTGLHILQHPGGNAMMLSLSNDGITWISPDAGRVQYVTRTKGGSSGSPCFDNDWRMVALHHAQRATTFGSVREGILFKPIHDEIAGYLPR